MLFPLNDQPPAPPDQHLDRAYRSAHYVVNGDRLQIGHAHPDFDRWLAEHGHTTYLIVTAHNPGSHPLPAAENLAREGALLQIVEERKLSFVPAYGADPEGIWKREDGLCLLDVPRPVAYALAAGFGQNAVVAGEGGGNPRLFWLR